MTYYQCNKSTKSYCNRTIFVKVIVEDEVACFILRHGVDFEAATVYPALGLLVDSGHTGRIT